MTVDAESQIGLDQGYASYWTRPRRRIREYLDTNHPPSVASTYISMIEIAYGRELPSRPEIVAHLARELINILTMPLGTIFNYKKELDTIGSSWNSLLPLRAALRAKPISELGENSMEVPERAGLDVLDCLARYQESNERSIEKHLRVLCENLAIAREDWERSLPAAKKLHELHQKLFGVPVHIRRDKTGNWKLAEECLSQLQQVLLVLASPFFENKRELDAILLKANRPGD